MVQQLDVRRAEWDFLPRSVENFWELALSSQYGRTVWFSKRYAKEYAGFLEWVSRAGDAEYDVIDLSEVEETLLKGARRKLVSLCLIAPERLNMPRMFDLRRSLDRSERRAYVQEWEMLRHQNSPVRVLENGRLISVDASHFDALILSFAETRWLKVARVLGHALAESSDATTMQVGDTYLGGRIAALVRQGLLEAQGDTRNWRHSEVRLPANRADPH
jgi:hypothetical protein